MNSLSPVNALRRAALISALAAATCAAGVRLEQVAMADRSRAEGTAAASRERAARATTAAAAQATYGPRYASLRLRGIIGEPQRLAIGETMEEVARELHLRGVTWELAPTTINGSIFSSRMKLRAGVVHEEELLRLLDRLCERAPAAIRITRCTIDRTSADLRRDEDNLTAECELEWQTVRAKE